MKRIGVISDTHGVINPQLATFFNDVDEIWHAGDFGSIVVADYLKSFKLLRGVFGNCDDQIIRLEFPEYQFFNCENLIVGIIHIGGYPHHYTQQAKELIERYHPNIIVTGHSHILRIIYDKKYDLLHINPGSAGNTGIHKIITAVRFVVDGKDIKNMEILEIDRKNHCF